MSDVYTVRKLGDNDPDGYPRGWWGAFLSGVTVPSYVANDEGSVVAFVHRVGASCVIDRREPFVTPPLPEVVKVDTPLGTCDACGAVAYTELVNGGSPDAPLSVFTLCLHHHATTGDALARAGYTLVRDARHLLEAP